MRLVLRLILFLLLSTVSIVAAGVIVGLTGSQGIVARSVYGAATALGLLAATAICIRLNGSSWREVGIDIAPRRLRDLGLGFLVGSSLFAMVLVLQGLLAGGRWIAGSGSLGGLVSGLAVVLCLFLGEELLFRGYAFRQLVDAFGIRMTLALSACAFGIYHVVQTDNWAMGAVYAFLMPAVGGLVLGYALYRSGSLALPIGLHWGGNWVQAQVLGVGHTVASPALWVMPLTPDQAKWLAAPDLLQHMPYLLGVLGMALLVRRIPHTPHPGYGL